MVSTELAERLKEREREKGGEKEITCGSSRMNWRFITCPWNVISRTIKQSNSHEEGPVMSGTPT